MGGGKKQEIALLQDQLAVTENATIDNNDTDEYLAELDSKTQLDLAKIDKEVRIEEANIAMETAKYQADTELKIAKLEYEIKEMEAKNDAARIKNEEINALANRDSAQADIIAAEARKVRAEGAGSYYYGNSGYNWYGTA